MDAQGLPRVEVDRIERALFFEPPEQRLRISRFVMLLFFASVIAAGGLLGDSIATVIGAMIVAPLMTPIMGMVVSIILGNRRRLWRSFLFVFFGALLAIAIGFLVAQAMPQSWDPRDSAQIMARTAPRLLDIMVALASGGAGAYALSRSDIADALPGVAISISLVPPLVTVGILLSAQEPGLAVGAFQLFLTNFAAILLAGTVTFIATGLAAGVGRRPSQLIVPLLLLLLLGVAIAAPLASNSASLWTTNRRENAVFNDVSAWLAETDTELVTVRVNRSNVEIDLRGDGDLPDANSLLTSIRETIPDATVTIRNALVQREVFSSNATEP